MGKAEKSRKQTRTEGAVKAGDGEYIFPLTQMAGIRAGTGYSTGAGPVVEGERMQCALVSKARGTGSNPHHHPNEQWNYIVHYTIATEDEDVVFFAVKDMTHGIIGTPVDPTKGAYTGAKK